MSARPLCLVTAAETDRGRRRSGNEDSFAVETRETGSPARPCTLVVVADGMGGASAGEVASRMAVEAVVRTFYDPAGGEPGDALLRAVETANREVYERSSSNVELSGMGTTCTAIALRDGRAHFAHVGDSRAYLVRAGRPRRITSDHSLVAELVDRQRLSESQARVDARRNVVTRSVGIGPEVKIDGGELDGELQVGDVLVVCSDGLHGQVRDEEIARLVTEALPEKACRELVRLANDRGGPDNITVVVARATEDRRDWGLRRSGTAARRRREVQWLVVLALVALALAVAGMVWVFGRMS